MVRLLLLSAIGAFLFVFHGLSLHLTPWSQAIVNGIVKYGYPKTGQDATTVLLFREQNLRELKEPYPVSYERHAEILEALAVYEPRAVFVDFAFINPRTSAEIDHLKAALRNLKASGAAVYLAVPAPAADPRERGEIPAELRDYAGLASAQRDTEQGVSGVLTYDSGLRTADHKFVLPTPAFAMASKVLGIDPEREEAMEIVWANDVPEFNKRWMDCDSGSPWEHLLRMIKDQPMAGKLTCPYTRTITVGHLLGSTGDAHVHEALHGRAVFYGAAFQLTGDRVISPVYEELPGVYLHAMAYDNLVTFGRDYKRAHRNLGSVAGHHVSLAGIVDVALLVGTVAMLLMMDEPPARVAALGRRLRRISTSTKWAALVSVASLVALAVVVPAGVSAIMLGIPLMLAAVAVLHLSRPSEHPIGATRGFLTRHIVTLSVCIAAVPLFFVVDHRLGLDAALLLVVIPAYFVYKVLAVQDVLFAVTAILLVLAALVSFLPPMNLGPRNVVAYVAFFEVARHLIEHADRVAMQYVKLRHEHPDPSAWRLGRRSLATLDWVFKLFLRAENAERRHAHAAGSV